jgi:hypothetical protein
LRANRRASWLHHVDSRLDDIAAAARGLERRRQGEAPVTVRGDGVGRRRRVGIAGRRRGGELQRGRRRNRPATAESCGGGTGENGGRGGGKFQRCVFARVHRDAARCSRRVTFGAPDSANSRTPQKFAASPWIARLLEGRFRLRALYTDSFFNAYAL